MKAVQALQASSVLAQFAKVPQVYIADVVPTVV